MTQNLRTLRHTLKQKRRALSAKDRRRLAFLASLHLPKLCPLLPKRAKVGVYLDDFGELPTAHIFAFCQKHRWRAYLPITQKNQALRFAPVQYPLKKTLLKRHRLGMKEPFLTHAISANQLDAIICPLVAVDKSGNRLGMGGGFYDRTFDKAPHVLKIGWCYAFQRVDKLHTNAWDKSVDMVLTDKGVVRF